MFRLDNLGIVIEAPSGPYPYGRLINSSPPGTGNGSPAVAEWANDPLMGMYAALGYFGLSPSDLQEQVGNSDFIRILSAVMPPGTFIPVAFTTDPATLNIRALPCDGSAVSETTYAELLAAIGHVWDTGGEPGGTFRVPELRGEFLRGWDNARGIDPARVFAALQLDAFQGHTFSTVKGDLSTDVNVSNVAGADIGGAFGTGGIPYAISTDGVSGTPRTASETRGRNQTVRFLIRY